VIVRRFGATCDRFWKEPPSGGSFFGAGRSSKKGRGGAARAPQSGLQSAGKARFVTFRKRP